MGSINSDPVNENLVKSAMLYKMIRFVSWPNKPSEIKICTIAPTDFNAALKEVIKNSKNENIIEIIYLGKNRKAIDSCHVIYFDNKKTKENKILIKNIEKKPILTVSDKEGFIKYGGIVELYKEKNKIKFSISIKAKKKSGLKISSKMLTLAKIVE